MIKTKKVKIKDKDYHIDITKAKAYKPEKFDDISGELEVDVNVIDSDTETYRLIYDGSTVMAYLKAAGVTETIYDVFEGTEAEVKAFADANGLTLPEIEE